MTSAINNVEKLISSLTDIALSIIDDKHNVINSPLQMSAREVNGINADTADEMALNTAINNDGIICTNDEMIR